jgi:hypothetical protein
VRRPVCGNDGASAAPIRRGVCDLTVRINEPSLRAGYVLATLRRIRGVESDHFDEIYIAERIDTPGAWTVEAHHKTIFVRPQARERAQVYMRNQ